jgi:hypothetical protein
LKLIYRDGNYFQQLKGDRRYYLDFQQKPYSLLAIYEDGTLLENLTKKVGVNTVLQYMDCGAWIELKETA